MYSYSTLLKAALVADFITPPILDDGLLGGSGGLTTTAKAQPPAGLAPSVMWRDIMPAPRKAGWGRDYDFSTTPASYTLRTSIDEVSQENGGEDWWYDICPLKDAGGNLIGYAAAGYNTMPNWGFEDQLGCGSEVDPYDHNELETNLNRKGFQRCWVARYDLSGNMVWCKSSLAGTFYGITQASDGSILAVGEASHNRMGEDLMVGHPNLGYNPGLTEPVTKIRTHAAYRTSGWRK